MPQHEDFLDIWFRPIRPEVTFVKDPTNAAGTGRLALLSFLMVGFVFTLSGQVNSIAYLTGQAPTVSFLPQSHSSQCAQGSTTNCWMSTTGILEDTGTRVVHAGTLAIGQPISVRAPLWRWDFSGLELLDDRGAEVYTCAAGELVNSQYGPQEAQEAASQEVRHRPRGRKPIPRQGSKARR